MRIRLCLAATLALVVVLALGSTGTSAAPSAATENAVVYWSGVAAGAIVAGRAPASSAVLGGMVHGAMYDAVAAVEGGLKPFATGVTAPPGARPMRPSRRLRGTSSSPVCRVRRRSCRPPTTPTWRRSPTGLRRTQARPSAWPPRRGCSRCGPAITSTTSFRTSSSRPGRACSSRSRRRRRSTRSSRSCGRSPTPRRPTTGPDGPIELTSKRYAKDVAELQAYGRVDSTVRTPAADRDRPVPHRADVLPVQPHPA